MKHGLIVVCVLALAVTAVAQEKDVTTVTTTETSGADLLSPPLWQFEDAQPIDARKIDLRMGFHWMTASAPASRGDSSDDFILSPTVVWGAAENVQLSLSTPIWLGAGGNVPGLHNGVGDDFDNFRFWDRGDDSDGGLDGQADAYVGLLWKLLDQKGECSQCGHGQFPAVALSATGRFPTGCGSSGIDGELRLIMTYEYDNGIRTHLNGFIKDGQRQQRCRRPRFPVGRGPRCRRPALQRRRGAMGRGLHAP